MLPRIDGLPRVYWTLWAGTLVNRLGGFVVPFLSLYLTREGGISVADVGFLLSLYGAGSLAAGPVGGALADRVGRRPTLLFGLCSGSVAMVALGFVQGAPALAAATFALGFFGDLMRPAVQAAVADVVPPEDRTRAFGLLYWAINLGFAIAPVIAGLVAVRGFTWLFVADAATTLAFAGIVAVKVPETRPPLAHPRDGGWSPAAPLRDPVFAGFLAAQLLLSLCFQQAFVTLPIDLRAHGIDPARYGTLIAINGLLIVVLQPFAIDVARRFRRTRVLAAGSALTGVGFGLTALVATAPGYALSIAVWTLGEIAVSSVAMVVVMDLAPPARRGAYQGAFQLVWGVASLVAPAIGAMALAGGGASLLWGACLVTGLAAAVAHALLPIDRTGTVSTPGAGGGTN